MISVHVVPLKIEVPLTVHPGSLTQIEGQVETVGGGDKLGTGVSMIECL